jgi:hypothetical protein
MRERIQTRLEELRKEFEAGQAELHKVKQQRTYLRETLLRISGAQQVLEELLAKEQSVERRNQAAEAPSDQIEMQHDASRVSKSDV